jgi:hypothetical protein
VDRALYRQWLLKLINLYGYLNNRIKIEVPTGAGRDAERGSVRAEIVVYISTGLSKTRV